MLNSRGFDLWADDYDRSVGLSDEDSTYPFAGYKAVLNAIYNQVMSHPVCNVLDLGFGTATLTSKLYAHGFYIYGQDFSERMIELAHAKMPDAKLYQGDFSLGLNEKLTENKYDFIIATYSLHHLSDNQKAKFIPLLLSLLNDGGHILIGDIAFSARTELEACREKAGDDWDDDEIYFVHDELKKIYPDMKFQPFSHCAGVLSLTR